MGFNEYQQKATEFAIFPKEFGLIYPILGLCGETGEVAEKFKKVIRDEGGWMDEQKTQEFAKELGDVLWYLAAIAQGLGLSLESIANTNIEKLESRRSRNVLKGSGDNR